MNKADMNYIEILVNKNKELKNILEAERCDADCYIDSLKQELEIAIKGQRDFKEIIKDRETIIEELRREIDAKDSLITSYKVAGAKLFHENERLKKRIEELEKIEG